MKPVCIHDKRELETFLLQHRQLNYYTLGDLDGFYWPYTTWYALKEKNIIKAVLLIYAGTELPVLLAINNHNADHMMHLLTSAIPLLPAHLYTHLSPGLENVLQTAYGLTSHGEHYKMVLKDASKLDQVDVSMVRSINRSDLDDLQEFYTASYPGNWFDARMLETGQYFGIRDENGGFASVAGVHVYSRRYKIAALGNITTHPDHRGKGLGTAVTAKVSKSLLKSVDILGLNVRADNLPAIQIYKNLGFEVLATYHEYMAELLSG